MANGANLILQAAQAGLQNVAPVTNLLAGLEGANVLKQQGLQNQLLQQQLAQQQAQAPIQQQLLQQRLQAGEQGLQAGQFELDQAARGRLVSEIASLAQEGLALPANARRAHILNRLATVDFQGLNESELISEINQMDDSQFESALTSMVRQTGGDAELIPSSARAVKIDGMTYMEYETKTGETKRFPVSGEVAKKTTGETVAEEREAEVSKQAAIVAAKGEAEVKTPLGAEELKKAKIKNKEAQLTAENEAKKAALRSSALVAQADNTLEMINGVLDGADWTTTGPVGVILSAIPGTDAFNQSEIVDSIKSNIGFDKLQQMRDMSPTGGALGQVAVQELEALQKVISSLKTGLSPAQFRISLKRVKQHYENWKDTLTADKQDHVPSSVGRFKIEVLP